MASGFNRSTGNERPSQAPGRTHIQTHSRGTASEEVYDVTAGKTFHLTTLTLMAVPAVQASPATQSQLFLRDGGVADAVVLPFTFTPSVADQTVGQDGEYPGTTLCVMVTFPEPLQFTDAVYADLSFGIDHYAISLTGYEE